MSKIVIGRKGIEKLPFGEEITVVKKHVFLDVVGFTYEFHTFAETCTADEMCVVVHFKNPLNSDTETATYPLSVVAYITIED